MARLLPEKCAARGGTPWDSRADQALNQCYAQGISTDHPLYAAFRKATLNRNDAEALAALRSITRLNPSDANAASELARMDAKVLTTRLEHLGTVLARGNAALIASEVEEIESAGFKTRPDGEIWRAAALVRSRVLLEEATKARANSKWATTLSRIELIRRLQKDLRLEFAPGELQQLDALEKWTAVEQDKDRENRKFQSLLSDLARQIQLSEEKDTSSRYVELPEMRADFEALHKVWRALTDFTRPIPEDATAAFQKRSALLETEIARRMAVRRRTILATAAACLLVGATIVWIVLGQMKAHQFARQLESAVSQSQTRVAERLLESVQTTGKKMLHVSTVNVAVADTESLITKENGLLTNFNTTFAQLPTHLGDAVDAARVNKIAEQLTQTRAALNALSPDLKAENEPRLNAFEQQWQQYLSDAAATANGAFEQLVVAAEKQSEPLDYRSPEKAAKQLADLSPAVQKMNAYQAGFTNNLALRSDLIQRAASVQARFDAYNRELKKLDDGLAALRNARTFADFSATIDSMASSEFSSAPAAVAAKAVHSLGTSEELVLRSLLNATNSATWAYIKKAKAPYLIPEIAMPAENARFQQFNADPAINANHQRYRFWLDPDKTKGVEWITAGVLDSSIGWKQIKAWEVSPGATNAVFEDHNYGYFNGQWKLSVSQTVYRLDQFPLKDTAALDAAALAKVSPGGETYSRPLLQSLDNVKDSDEGSPIFRAYLICELEKMMEFQPDEWGLSFCPSLKTDVAKIHEIVGGEISTGDWFVPLKVNAWNSRLRQFLATAKSVSYTKEAMGKLIVAQAALRQGLHYVGFAGLDGKPIITDPQARDEICGYDAHTKQPVIISDSAMPLSPLFAFPTSPADFLAQAGVESNVPPSAGAASLLSHAKN